MRELKELVRKNIWELTPYSCARNEYSGKNASIFIDANENPYKSQINRYPDPLQIELKEKISSIKGVPIDQIFLGNGSDEAIDLVFRVFCEPKVDNVVAISPTYGMYQVCASINDIEYRPVLLDSNFDLDPDSLLSACDEHTKAIFICSPNNPTGNTLTNLKIEKILKDFSGIVVLDEAYSDFSEEMPFRFRIQEFPNTIILNTFSKAWGCAGMRLGMAYAQKEIIDLFNKVKYPYNINTLTINKALEVLKDITKVDRWIQSILDERATVMQAVATLPICQTIYPSSSNFFLAKFNDANKVYDYLINKGIVVRNRTTQPLCSNCIRITIGTPEENNQLIAALRTFMH